jgi:YkoY family integral membrane protein
LQTYWEASLQEIIHVVVVIGTLVVLEGLLSADNALVLAVLVRNLPKHQQRKGLTYGIVGAFVFRFVALFLAAHIIRLWYLRTIGAVYLLYLAVSHLLRHSSGGEHKRIKTYAGFWRTVLAVELTDIAFSIDSVVVAVGLSEKLWIVYTGAILGIITMRLVADVFVRVLERFPSLEVGAYVLVGWIGLKLSSQSIDAYREAVLSLHPLHIMPVWVFWAGMATIVVSTVAWAFRCKWFKGKDASETEEAG